MLKQQTKSKRSPKVALEQITPAKAAKLLEANTRNRNLNQLKVDEYAALMAAGQWIDGVADISIDSDGVLQNGQHTLTAVIRSGVTIVATVKHGMQPKGQDVTDIGRRRTVADQLAIDGVKNASTVAAMARIVMFWREHGRPPSMSANGGTAHVVSHLEVLAYARAHRKQLQDEARLAVSRQRSKLLTGTQAGVLNTVLTDAAPEWGSMFMAQLFDEVDESAEAVRALRAKLTHMRDKSPVVSPLPRYAFTIKAFNAFVSGATIKKFGLKPNETFPAIVIPEWAD